MEIIELPCPDHPDARSTLVHFEYRRPGSQGDPYRYELVMIRNCHLCGLSYEVTIPITLIRRS